MRAALRGPGFVCKWWIHNGSTWLMMQDWSTSNTFARTPATASSAYRIAVWVRSAGNSTDTYENANANGSIGYTITAVAAPPLFVTSVTRSHLSPQPVGTTMTFTANATGGIPPYQYRWRMSTDGGNSFFFPTAWSDSPTFVWTPSSPFAEVRIQVMVRNTGNTTDIFDVLFGTFDYVITVPSGGPLALTRSRPARRRLRPRPHRSPSPPTRAAVPDPISTSGGCSMAHGTWRATGVRAARSRGRRLWRRARIESLSGSATPAARRTPTTTRTRTVASDS